MSQVQFAEHSGGIPPCLEQFRQSDFILVETGFVTWPEYPIPQAFQSPPAGALPDP